MAGATTIAIHNACSCVYKIKLGMQLHTQSELRGGATNTRQLNTGIGCQENSWLCAWLVSTHVHVCGRGGGRGALSLTYTWHISEGNFQGIVQTGLGPSPACFPHSV